MQRSDELLEAASLLFKQIADLGTRQWSSGFDIWNANEVSAVAWMTNPDGSIGMPFVVPYTEDPFFKQIYAARQSGTDFFVMESSGKELEETYLYLFNLADAKKHFDGVKSLGFQMPAFQITYCAFFSQGFLMFITYEPVPEMWDIFKRFAKVFEQTYTRFLDLQRAEAQAREAQIQLALERVRARGMAMYHSNELADLLDTVFRELTKLDIKLDRCIIMIHDPKTFASTWWLSNPEPGSVPVGLFVQYHEHKPYLDYLDAWKNRILKWEYLLEGNSKKEWDNFLFSETELSRLPEFVIDGMKSFGRIFLNVSFNNFGSLTVSSAEPLDDASTDLLLRFAKVFDSTYTRFNDLQKAEAQAREAQIEAALERVRSRTMAMQRSEELAEVATVLFQQVKALGVPQWTCGFSIFEIDDKEFTWYPGGADGEILPPNKIPLTEHPVFISFNESRKRGDELFVYEKGGEFQADHYRYMRSLPGGEEMYQNTLKAGITFPAFQIDHIANFSHGNLVFITYEHFLEMHDVFKRFAKVFEQTYTRFLDLQKAEAQAREAKIQLAMERVRARTMAMHNSEDVSTATATMFTELEKLGIENVRCGIAIVSENKMMEVWSVTNVDDKKTVGVAGVFDMNTHKLWQLFFEAWHSQSGFIHYYLTGKEKENYISLLNNNSNYLSQPILEMPDMNFQSYQFKEGSVWTFSMKPHTAEEQQLMKRFTAVFSLTFRRYQDLQKAEAQAREAQIQLALERVRARAMAMQKSDELKELIGTVFIELTKLDLVLTRCLIMIYDTETNASTWWMANSETPTDPIGLYIKYHDYPPYLAYIKAWQQRKNKWQYILEGTDKKEWDDFLFVETELSHLPDFVIAGMKEPDRVYLNASFNSFGNLTLATLESLSEEHFDILLRFAKVFDLTYTRFNDLKQAEAQTREARIEAALERVRSRTLAMQKRPHGRHFHDWC